MQRITLSKISTFMWIRPVSTFYDCEKNAKSLSQYIWSVTKRLFSVDVCCYYILVLT